MTRALWLIGLATLVASTAGAVTPAALPPHSDQWERYFTHPPAIKQCIMRREYPWGVYYVSVVYEDQSFVTREERTRAALSARDFTISTTMACAHRGAEWCFVASREASIFSVDPERPTAAVSRERDGQEAFQRVERSVQGAANNALMDFFFGLQIWPPAGVSVSNHTLLAQAPLGASFTAQVLEARDDLPTLVRGVFAYSAAQSRDGTPHAYTNFYRYHYRVGYPSARYPVVPAWIECEDPTGQRTGSITLERWEEAAKPLPARVWDYHEYLNRSVVTLHHYSDRRPAWQEPYSDETQGFRRVLGLKLQQRYLPSIYLSCMVCFTVALFILVRYAPRRRRGRAVNEEITG